jgi:predicted nucleic-acid-binding Zn-ribbon protein
MKTSVRCPKCTGRKIAHVTEIQDKVGGATQTFALRSDQRIFGIDDFGVLEAFVCVGCGYTEWYTKEPHRIPIDGKAVRLLDATGPKSGYR